MDYQSIIDNLTDEAIIKMMTKLGADRYEDKGDFLIFPTICHNIDVSDASMKLYFYKNNKLFVCWTEDGNMSIFKFLKTYYETRDIEYNWYEDIYRVVIDCANIKPKEGFNIPVYKSLSDKYKATALKKLPTYNEGILDCFIKYYPTEWLNDRISKETMDKFNIRFSIGQNKIIIPHYNIDGELVGIRGRALNEWEIENLGKYMPVQIEKKWYSHPLSLNLYGLNKTKENIKKYGICYIGEAEKFVLQMDGYGMPNCSAAVCGSQFNKFQFKILMKECQPKEIVLCFDNEEKQREDKYFKKLWGICEKFKNYCNMSFVYDRDGLLKLKESPTDCGEEVFKRLIERRVKVK